MTEQHLPATPVRGVAEVATHQAERYMTQLCKHFQHTIPVTFDQQTGEIAFAAGTCRLRAEPARLVLSVEAADAPGLAQLQDVVARHLVRFAFRDDMQVTWHNA